MTQASFPTDVPERIGDPTKFSINDLHLAGVYWPILMGLAAQNQQRPAGDFVLIQYADLVASAKRTHPQDPVVQNAINTSIGRKLDPINWFCRDNDLPNLTCLAVNVQGQPGIAYMRNNDWEAEKAEVAAFDWTTCSLQFSASIEAHTQARIEKASAQRREMSDEKARELLWAWWEPRRALYPNITLDQREQMVKLIRKWISVEEAVAAVLGIE